MGLDCSHDAWSGGYMAFDRWRSFICKAWGGKWPETIADMDMMTLPVDKEAEDYPGLMELLTHGDCDGEITPDMCVKVADELTALLPTLQALEDECPPEGRFASSRGRVTGLTQKFIEGCRRAAASDEPLSFH